MFNNNRDVAVKKNFKMAAATTLDLVGMEFWRQNGLWSMVFSPCVCMYVCMYVYFIIAKMAK